MAGDSSSRSEWLVVESADGKQQKKIQLEPELRWDYITEWLDSQHLVFNDAPLGTPMEGVLPVGVLNPFTGQFQVLASDYPNIVTIPEHWLTFRFSTVVYEPSLRFVMYPLEGPGAYYLGLWDRQTNVLVSQLGDHGAYMHRPLWWSGSRAFIVPVDSLTTRVDSQFHEDWFRMGLDGRVEQLTHLADRFQSVHIGDASLSPDEQRLAFWIDSDPTACTKGENLAVLTFTSRAVVDYCVFGTDRPPDVAPIWSPDGRFIAVESAVSQRPHLSLVDMQQGWVVSTTEQAYPKGWLATP